MNTLLPVLAFLSAILLICIVYLIFRLRRQEAISKALSEDLLVVRETLDRAPVNIFRLDKALKVVNVNATAARGLGMEQEQLIGRNLAEIDPDYPENLHKEVESLTTASPPKTYGGSICGADGACYPTRDIITLVAVADKEYVIRYGIDIADEVKLRSALEKETEKVRQSLEMVEVANRMKSDFIANMNHEIRTPMNAIIGYSEMLADAGLDSRQQRFVATIHKSGLALIGILNDIMDLSRLESGSMEIVTSTVTLHSIVKEVVDLFAMQVEEKHLRLEYTVAKDLPKTFITDGKRLKQILQNLVSNAVKFTDNGSITITVSGIPSSGVDGCCDLTFGVEDTGIGIPAAEQGRVFNLFEQYDSSIAKKYGGVGIGLTLCGQLTAMLGGTIEFTSAEGVGSKFIVHLHAVQVAVADTLTVVADPVPVAAHIKAAKLLVVDDMELITDVFIDYFSDSPVEILTAAKGEEALTIAAAERPAVIFMDLNLIGMGGMEVTRILRQDPATAAIPVVVMTGAMLAEDDYKPLFDDFLQKPFHLETLKKVVARYIDSGPGNKKAKPEFDVATGEDLAIFKTLKTCWHDGLGDLLRTAMSSGNLAAAATLGGALKETGSSCGQRTVQQFGEQLTRYATEPNIIGVEQILSDLFTFIEQERE